MAECPSIKNCPFYNDRMSGMVTTVSLFENKYCKHNNQKCARWKVTSTLGKEYVPLDLYPNQIEDAYRIITRQIK